MPTCSATRTPDYRTLLVIRRIVVCVFVNMSVFGAFVHGPTEAIYKGAARLDRARSAKGAKKNFHTPFEAALLSAFLP